MTAPQPAQPDNWGRETPETREAELARLLLAAQAVAAAGPAGIDPVVLGEIAAMRQRLSELEAQLGVTSGEVYEPRIGAEWTRRLAQSVADHWSVGMHELFGNSSKRVFVRPRFAFCWLLRQVGQYSLNRVAVIVRYDDHTSVIHAIRRSEQWRREDESFLWATDRLRDIGERFRDEARAKRGLPAPVADEVAA